MSPAIGDWETSSSLLERLTRFDEVEWSKLVRRLRPAVVNLARRVGLPEAELDDAVQDTFLTITQVWKEGRYDRARGRLRPFLFKIAYRRVIDRLRAAESHRLELSPRTEDGTSLRLRPDLTSLERAWDRSWHLLEIQDVLQRLRGEFSGTTWRAFELTVLDARPCEFVADELGMSRNAVYIAKYRVLQRLNVLLRERDTGETR